MAKTSKATAASNGIHNHPKLTQTGNISQSYAPTIQKVRDLLDFFKMNALAS